MVRNLIFHIAPLGCWRWNIEQLRERLHLFNGVKIAAVSYGEGMDSIKEVQEILPEIDYWVFEPNDTDLRESVTLLPMLELLERHRHSEKQSITFFGHTKGTSRGDNEAVRNWTRLCYEHNLDRIQEVEKQLQVYYATGTFKTNTLNVHFPKESRWHYSGSFWWGRTDKIFEGDWNKFPLMRYTFEAYPSLLFTKDSVGCIFGEQPAIDLYKIGNVRKWMEKSETIFNKLASKNKPNENEIGSKESSKS